MDEKGLAYKRQVNYYETDKMGIVHHSNYIRFFEEARIDFLDKIGLNYKKIEDMGLIMPVLGVECKYIKPLHFSEDFCVNSRVAKYNGMKLTVEYEIYNRDGELVTTGRSEHCLLDKDLNPVNIKRNYPDIYNKLKELVEDR